METTEWFATETPPVRAGVFETQTASDIACVGTKDEHQYFNHWDGKKWGGSGTTPEKAALTFAQGCGTVAPIVRWRGLLEQPV